jgi:hypothetical protein
MKQNEKEVSIGGIFVLGAIFINAIVLKQGLITHKDWYGMLLITIPLLIACIITFKREQ